MRKILVIEDDVIVGMREPSKAEAIRDILDNDYYMPYVIVPREMEDLLENTLESIQDRLRQAFFEGAEAERDCRDASAEFGEEVELVNPYA